MIKFKAEAWILLLILSLIWGSSFILMKKRLEAYPPAQMASLRIIIAGLCLVPVALKNIRYLNRRKLFYIFLFGLLNAGLPAFLFALSETVVSSSTAGILNSLTPIFTFLAGVLFFRTRFNWLGLAGVIIGFSGGCLLIFNGNQHPGNLSLGSSQALYSSLILVATICYGFSGNIIKHYLQEVPGYIVSSFSYLIFGIPLLVWLLFFSDFTFRVVHNPEGIHSLLYITILAVLGSAMAIILVVRLIQVSNALFGSFVTYLIPIVSIMWGVLAGESITIITIISLLIILGGILVAGMRTIPGLKGKNLKT